MKGQNRMSQLGKVTVLALLVMIPVFGWSQLGDAAQAQESGSKDGDIITTVEPISPIDTPEPEPTDDSETPPPVDNPVDQEPGLSPVKVILEPAEPTAEPAPTDEPEPTGEPDDIGVIIDPPSAEELGEPIKDETSVARDDITDEEGGVIDIFDLTFVAARYGTADPAADINLDGTVDIFDLTILASNFGRSEPTNGDTIISPTPVPEVEASGADFGIFDLPVEAEDVDAEAQYYYHSRPLRIGVSINYVHIFDAADSTSAPDPYAQVAVGYVPVRTSTIYNRYVVQPYWRLGWWRYAYFPWSPRYAPNYYSVPVDLEIRDDDGYVCYGYYGCRYQYQYVDISPPLYRYTKRLILYPSACMVVDEAGTRTYGTWLNSNLCRVYLRSWGSEWPRGYVNYYLDVQWN